MVLFLLMINTPTLQLRKDLIQRLDTSIIEYLHKSQHEDFRNILKSYTAKSEYLIETSLIIDTIIVTFILMILFITSVFSLLFCFLAEIAYVIILCICFDAEIFMIDIMIRIWICQYYDIDNDIIDSMINDKILNEYSNCNIIKGSQYQNIFTLERVKRNVGQTFCYKELFGENKHKVINLFDYNLFDMIASNILNDIIILDIYELRNLERYYDKKNMNEINYQKILSNKKIYKSTKTISGCLNSIMRHRKILQNLKI